MTMLKFLVAYFMVFFFWNIYKIFLVIWSYGERETGDPSENYDESCLVNQRENEKNELSCKGNEQND